MEENKLVVSGKAAAKINPDMIGLFFEDINFAADGGLYAEMIENRSFEAVRSCGENHNYVLREEPYYAWKQVYGESGLLDISVNEPVNEKNPHYLRFTANRDGDGFANKAYDGITLKKGQTYNISFFAREVNYPEGDIRVAVIKGGRVYGETVIGFLPAGPSDFDPAQITADSYYDKKWKQYTGILTALEDVEEASFEVHLTKAGTVEFDLISMIPGDAVCGIFRKDLFEALKDLHPGFLRFPGGCIVEGTSLMRRYRWKNTVGSLAERKITSNLWAVSGGNTLKGNELPDSHYMQSYGLGFYEYFLLCELLSSEGRKCMPLPVLNIGVACQFRSFETVPFGTPEFEEYVQDALDLIEFANGSTDTKWGRLRADMGHAEPFGLEMLSIGNEQWESMQVDLYRRYRRFEEAIHEKYPEIRVLGTAGPNVKTPSYESAWNFYKEENAEKPGSTYAVDEHYYVKPAWLYENVTFYDDYPRDIGVFAGEYAGHDANQSNSVEAALAEAAMLTGMERNGDVVKLASYAPLFNRIGHSQWTPDLIWFDNKETYLTPSYFVQKLFSDNSGEEALELSGQEKELRKNGIYISLVRNGNDTILKAVNAKNEPQMLKLFKESGSPMMADASVTVFGSIHGLPKKVVRSEATGTGAGKPTIDVSFMSNRKLCMLRFPEESFISTSRVFIEGEAELAPGTLTVIRF